MKHFLRGCLVGLGIGGTLCVAGFWFYGATLVIDLSPLGGVAYCLVSIILFCGVMGWLANR